MLDLNLKMPKVKQKRKKPTQAQQCTWKHVFGGEGRAALSSKCKLMSVGSRVGTTATDLLAVHLKECCAWEDV